MIVTIGLDVGYYETKLVALSDKKIERSFPSIVGTPDMAKFAAMPERNFTISVNGTTKLIGKEAIEQSRWAVRREDRSWIESEQWKMLFLAALSEITTKKTEKAILVTGLPVSFFRVDREKVKSIVLGEHTFRRGEREEQTIEIVDVRVMPQPFGSLFNETLDGNGKIANSEMLQPVGVVDIGSKTVNFLLSRDLRDISPKTVSIDKGGWDVARALQERMLEDDRFSDIDYSDHEWIDAVINKYFWYGNTKIDITDVLAEITKEFANEVIAASTQMWGNGRGVRQILITGGGALLIGEWLIGHFPHARILRESVLSNARGYFKFAQKIAGG